MPTVHLVESRPEDAAERKALRHLAEKVEWMLKRIDEIGLEPEHLHALTIAVAGLKKAKGK